MRELLRGYTMFANGGVDYGYEIEQLGVVLPEEEYSDHDYGGTVMTAEISRVRIGKLNPTVKFMSHNPDVVGMLMRAPGTFDTFTFRGALVDEIDGTTRSNVITYEGRLSQAKADPWSKSDKSGIMYTIQGVRYFQYDIQNVAIHKIGLMPSMMIVNGVDRLAAINQALGR